MWYENDEADIQKSWKDASWGGLNDIQVKDWLRFQSCSLLCFSPYSRSQIRDKSMSTLVVSRWKWCVASVSVLFHVFNVAFVAMSMEQVKQEWGASCCLQWLWSPRLCFSVCEFACQWQFDEACKSFAVSMSISLSLIGMNHWWSRCPVVSGFLWYVCYCDWRNKKKTERQTFPWTWEFLLVVLLLFLLLFFSFRESATLTQEQTQAPQSPLVSIIHTFSHLWRWVGSPCSRCLTRDWLGRLRNGDLILPSLEWNEMHLMQMKWQQQVNSEWWNYFVH